uniref:Uncharacterized protein n=1 Tax=Capsicum annuum TaxID=4072 RepID=A0A075VWQ4_CAPAN|nr:hypothetical protein [Capsicum annuum]
MMFTSTRLGHYLKVSFSLFSSYITTMEEIVSTTFYATISSSLMIFLSSEKKKRLPYLSNSSYSSSFLVEVPLLRQLVQWFLSWMTGILWMDGKSRYAAGL